MNERELEIPLHDGKVIRGSLAGEWSWPLIIFIHGLTAHKEEVLPYAASRWFAEHHYAFLRFNLYDGEENSRKMAESDLFTHAADLNAIVCFVKNYGVDQVFLVGHSLGAYTVAMADKHWVNGAILWDPSHPTEPSITTRSYPYLERVDGYLCNWGVTTLLPARLVESMERFSLIDYAREWTAPTLITCAGDSGLTEAGDRYASILQKHTEICRGEDIDGADHNFTTDDWRVALFTQSYEWLIRH